MPSAEIEQIWLSKLRNGEETALREIFDQYYSWLLSEASKVLNDDDSCKDVVQEVFVELWRRRESLEIRQSLPAYLKRATFNRAINLLKSQQRFSFSDDIWKEGDSQEFQEMDFAEEQAKIIENESLSTDLQTAIESLPEKCRLVFRLSRFEERSHREIAEQLGISVKTIENQITKALRILRAAMVNRQKLSSIVILALEWWLRHRG